MYVLYTGMFPFYHEVEKVLMDMILELPPPPPSKHNQNLAPGIERIILDCLKKNPEERYPDAGALREAIQADFPDYGCRLLPLF
jgi:serine/threonine protein kinase